MSFVSHTEQEIKEMLAKIGVSSVEDLIKVIPDQVRLKKDLDIPRTLTEYEAVQLLGSYANMNKSADKFVCFNGGGAYHHYIPALVMAVLESPAFKTAYTPYQAEVSQGTLQAMYEFQSMICALTGMDVANASMYDGGTALAEACFLSAAHNKRKHFVIAGAINPNYRKVMEGECAGKEFTFTYVENEEGLCDIEALKKAVTAETSAVIVQNPNPYGNIENVFEIGEVAHANSALYISVVDPISLGILETPKNYKADIVVAEGQPLGIPMSFGGPYLGIFAVTQELLRKIPGRISGITQDADGKRGFVLTLQTREQQIKREKATSNICSNQGLFMLAATVYMAVMGKSGIREVAEKSLENSHYLAGEIQKLGGYSLLNDKPFFKEFLVKTPVPAKEILAEAVKEGILGGIDTKAHDFTKEGLLIAVTEIRNKEEMDRLLAVLKKFAK